MGPIARFVLGIDKPDAAPAAPAAAPVQAEPPIGMFGRAARQLGIPGAADLARRPGVLEAADPAGGAPAGAPPSRMTPEQESDWRQVASGGMKLHEFQRKHGFIPR